jgi:hypothetical protein
MGRIIVKAARVATLRLELRVAWPGERRWWSASILRERGAVALTLARPEGC